MSAHHPSASIPRGAGPYTDEDVCQYIQDMCLELRSLSRRPRLRTLHYLIDMVRLEAERTVRQMKDLN